MYFNFKSLCAGIVLIILHFCSYAELVIGVSSQAMPPYLYYQDKKPVGVIPMMLEQVFTKIGQTYIIKTYPGAHLKNFVKLGYLDAAVLPPVSEVERQPDEPNQPYIFYPKESLVDAKTVLIKRSDLDKIDKKPIKIGLLKQQALSKKEYKQTEYHKMKDLINALRKQQVDAILADDLLVQYTMQHLPKYQQVEVDYLDAPLKDAGFKLIFTQSKDHQQLSEVVDNILADIKQSERYSLIIKDAIS